MERTQERFEVGELWVDSVGVQSISIDWQETWNEGDGWESFETPSCPQCGEYAVREDDEEGVGWTCPDETCEQHGGEIDPYESGVEGPMMSYFYPLHDLARMGDDPYAAAEAIRDLPLCVVQFSDGSFALALTGGGMDLSWELCEAFTRLGYLPPLHFCDLPGISGYPRSDAHLYVIRACLRTADVAAGWAEQTRVRLEERYGAELRGEGVSV